MKIKREFFIGIDLGGKEKKTTGICILKRKKIIFLESVFGKDLLKKINPYLKFAQVVAIDAPLTEGKGKGKMRLYEKFLSTSIFRKEKVNPLPPALMPKLCDFAKEILQDFQKRGFVLGINLIETFPTLVKKVCRKNLFKNLKKIQGEHQKSALICAKIAFWHFHSKTCYLGSKDGFLFLPQISFWKKSWQKKFYQAWKDCSYLKYRYLLTNIFKGQE